MHDERDGGVRDGVVGDEREGVGQVRGFDYGGRDRVGGLQPVRWDVPG